MKTRWTKLLITAAGFYLMPVIALAQTLTNSTGTVNDINSMLLNVSHSVPGVVQLTFGACYVVGVWEILRAVYKLKRYAQGSSMMSQESSIAKPVITLFVGVGCIWLPTIMDTFIFTIWSYGTSSVIAYPESSGDTWLNVINPLIDVVRAFGLISIVRGWISLAKLGGEGGVQPGTTGKALMHIFGGIFAWNIVDVWNVVQNTLGIS